MATLSSSVLCHPYLAEQLSNLVDSRLSIISSDGTLEQEVKRVANMIEIEVTRDIQLCTDAKSDILARKVIRIRYLNGVDWDIINKVAEVLMKPPYGFKLVRPMWACRCRILYGHQREDEPDISTNVCKQQWFTSTRYDEANGKCGPQYIDVFFKPSDNPSSP